MSNQTSTSSTFTTEAYVAADVKGKATMRADIKKAISSAVDSLNFDLAKALVDVDKTFFTPMATVEVDWAGRIVDLYATLRDAAEGLKEGFVTLPEGVVAPDLSEVDWEAGTVDFQLAKKLATVAGRKAGRGAVVAWIESVIGDEPATISQLRSRWVATSDYPKAAPSAGAIGAAFDPIEGCADPTLPPGRGR